MFAIYKSGHTSGVVGNGAPAGCCGSGGKAVGGRAWKTLAGGHRVMQAGGETTAAVHDGALFGQLLQHAAPPG